MYANVPLYLHFQANASLFLRSPLHERFSKTLAFYFSMKRLQALTPTPSGRSKMLSNVSRKDAQQSQSRKYNHPSCNTHRRAIKTFAHHFLFSITDIASLQSRRLIRLWCCTRARWLSVAHIVSCWRSREGTAPCGRSRRLPRRRKRKRKRWKLRARQWRLRLNNERSRSLSVFLAYRPLCKRGYLD